jgi:HD-GYP domain-containing protein (c-di-GMP phosphodiesterase class II)
MNGEEKTKQEIFHKLGEMRLLLSEAKKSEPEKKLALSTFPMTEMVYIQLLVAAQAIAGIIETRDPYKADHHWRVAGLAHAIGIEMNLEGDQNDGIRLAGLIHDIGKISVPADILNKPRRLTESEFELVKVHAQSGYEMLKDIAFPWPVARVVLEHHERINGSGYPHGTTGDQLLMESRILAVSDVVNGISYHRPYRPALGIDAALYDIRGNRGILYDPEVVDACLALLSQKKYKMEEN